MAFPHEQPDFSVWLKCDSFIVGYFFTVTLKGDLDDFSVDFNIGFQSFPFPEFPVLFSF